MRALREKRGKEKKGKKRTPKKCLEGDLCRGNRGKNIGRGQGIAKKREGEMLFAVEIEQKNERLW